MTVREATPSYEGGRGDGPPLLLVHGLGMSWRAWRPVLGPLGVDHAVLAPTLPGHRGGPAAPVPVRVATLADHLERLLDDRGWERPHVVGNSLGGWLALELARRGRARSVTAISPAGASRHIGDQLRLQALLRTADALNGFRWTALSLAPLLPVPHGRRLVLRQLMERGDRVPAAEAREVLLDARDCTVVPGLLRAGRRDRFTEIDRVPCPTRVVWGRRDRVIPYRRHGRPLVRLLPGATEVSLPGAGHVPMYDAPVLLTSLIRENVVLGETRATGGAER